MSAPATTLHLDGELTIYRAAELKPLLLGDASALALDLSAVHEIDSAGLQLLLLARRERAALRLVAPSTPVRDALALAGLAAAFETEEAAA